MHIHVFAIDALPAKGIISTGGSLRSAQIIAGLRRAGAAVTYSVPEAADCVKDHWEQLTAEERENAFSLQASSGARGRSHLDIIARLGPDAVVYLWPQVFTHAGWLKKPHVTIFDLNGFQHIEGMLVRNAASRSAIALSDAARQYLNKVTRGDILLSGSEAQRAYWSGAYSILNDDLQGLKMIDVPFCPEVPAARRYNAGEPTFYTVGSFLPWNSPEDHLEILASQIREHGRGRLVIVGKANSLLPHAGAVNRRIRKLKAEGFVEAFDGLPYHELSQHMNGRGIGIDLNSRTMEREFAIPIRTVTFLAHGVPVITNDYSTISRQIGRYKAGWQINGENGREFGSVVRAILDDTSDLADRSARARTLIAEEFDTTAVFEQILNQIEQKTIRRRLGTSGPAHRQADTGAPRSATTRRVVRSVPPVVLIVTDEHDNFLHLRVKIPFDAMYRQGKIKGYLVMTKGKIVKSVGPPRDLTKVDVVWVQRAPLSAVDFVTNLFPNRFIYDIDDNLLISPSYRAPFSREWCNIITSLLRHSLCVTSTTPRLIDSLQRHSGMQLEHKCFLAPNVTDTVNARSFKGAPEALLLAASDALPLTESRRAFLSAIDRFCLSRAIPLIYLGSEQNLFNDLSTPVIKMGFLDYESYRAFLRNRNIMAISPLETRCDYITAEFINSKSDIKMVEFGASGVPAVYAKAIPYTDSDLECGPLVECCEERATVDKLDLVFDEADRFAATATESVADLRLADRLAATLWGQALDAGRLPVPVPIAQILAMALIYTGKSIAEYMVPEECFNESDYLAINPDIATEVTRGTFSAYQHYREHGFREQRIWFPGVPATADIQTLVARYRNVILEESGQLTELERVIAQRRK